MKNKKNKKHRIRSLKRNILTHINEWSGRMLTTTRSERKAENRKARALRKRDKLAKRVVAIDEEYRDAATATE
jgi:hypothetical protein